MNNVTAGQLNTKPNIQPNIQPNKGETTIITTEFFSGKQTLKFVVRESFLGIKSPSEIASDIILSELKNLS